MNPTNSYQKILVTYLAQVYKSLPSSQEFTTISSHQLLIPESGKRGLTESGKRGLTESGKRGLTESGKLVFPKPEQTESTHKTRYFITGISIHANQDNLAQQPSDILTILKIICGRQTWISGQLGLLDLAKLNSLIIPLPADDVPQEIELIIQDSTPENEKKLGFRGSLNYDVVVAPDFHGDDLPCYQQIIYSVPDTGIIYDGRNRLLAYPTNRIARIEIYVPEDLDYQPQVYCNDLAIKPTMRLETPNARTHNTVSGTAMSKNSGYKTHSFDGTKFGSDSQIRLELPQAGQIVKGKIKYSIIENQIVRVKNGYIGLAF